VHYFIGLITDDHSLKSFSIVHHTSVPLAETLEIYILNVSEIFEPLAQIQLLSLSRSSSIYPFIRRCNTKSKLLSLIAYQNLDYKYTILHHSM
jgi:hypothetical protein